MATQHDRNFVVRLLSDRLGGLSIKESPRIQQHLVNIVEVLNRRPGGLAALLDVLGELDDGSAPMLEVARFIAGS
ncbi:hypothetical protein H4W32_002005 [Actinophytocola algeriensis]|uniref:Effector-associated domain-containing protein n=2 Tax=Actinophytocola algeriensis TaxID=1768010 RepID=A0A7W7QC77_9PSEU|nr:hypothetical protein [Actinophytocola algeriensis]MBE1473963.1 hypothetical protein [Actinophytocola algeriensis]